MGQMPFLSPNVSVIALKETQNTTLMGAWPNPFFTSHQIPNEIGISPICPLSDVSTRKYGNKN